jgi:phage shock protein C
MACTSCGRQIAVNSNFCYFCGARQTPAGAAGKRLMRSSIDRKLAGVCGGVAEYFEVDPTIVRLLWAFITLVTGVVPGILAYVIGWIIMPEAPVPAVVVRESDKPAGTAPAPQAN